MVTAGSVALVSRPPLDDRYDVLNGMGNVNDTNLDFDTLPNKIVDVRSVYADGQLSQEFQFNCGGDNWQGVFGLYWFDGEAGGTVYNNFVNVLFVTTQGVVDTQALAIYGEGTFPINDTLSVTAGLRYTDESKEADVLNPAYANAT